MKKKIAILFSVLIFLAAAGKVLSAADIDVDQALKLLKKSDTVLLDVRTAAEFEEGHIRGAMWIPVGQIKKRYGEVPKDKDIIVYCTIGVRSSRARTTLERKGYRRVFNLKGGIEAWQAKGQPVVIGR